MSDFVRLSDYDLDELMTPEMVADVTGARVTVIVRLIRSGLLETNLGTDDTVLLPRRAVLRLRRMQRLRRDLGVNFAGASVILDLVERMEAMRREMAEIRGGSGR